MVKTGSGRCRSCTGAARRGSRRIEFLGSDHDDAEVEAFEVARPAASRAGRTALEGLEPACPEVGLTAATACDRVFGDLGLVLTMTN
jgi:hypothetical protein